MKRNMPTMKDVAKEAGVALGTVSRVFNGQSVGEDYRQRVEEAAAKLGYKVNTWARGLKTNKSNIIAVILPSTTHPYYASLAHELYMAANRRNYHMMLFLTGSNHEWEQECFEMVRQNKVDGIIGLTYSMLEVDDDVCFVSIDRHFGDNVPCVASDNYGGGRLAAEILAKNGCRNLLYLRTGSVIPSEADKRGDGFLTGCNLMGIPCDAVRINDSKDFREFREQFENHMVDGKLTYDGIFCVTDYLAVEICKMLREMGQRVPEDVQVIGFDGIHYFDTDDFLCSTIVQPTDKIAEQCMELVLNEDRSNIPSLVCLPVHYAVGGTTKE